MRLNHLPGWRAPVLMYHRVVQEARARPFCVPVRRFEQQMNALATLQFRVLPLDDLVGRLHLGDPLPRRSVAITFDDGYVDTYQIAAPILARHQFAATVFLVADRMGGHSDWDAGAAPAPLMSWKQAAELARQGIRIGSHTCTHAVLPRLPDDRLRAEVLESRRVLEARLGTPVHHFAYPYAETDARCQSAVRAAGYQGACAGARRGYGPFCLDRIDVTLAPLPVFVALISRWGYATYYALSSARQRLRAKRRNSKGG